MDTPKRAHFLTRLVPLDGAELWRVSCAIEQLLDDDPKIGKRVKTTVGVVRQSGDRKVHGLQFVPV